MKLILVLVLICALFPIAFCETCGDSDWIPYKSTKCVKLIPAELLGYLDAATKCRNINAQILTIKSLDEQQFMTEFIYDNKSIVGDVWLAASRIANTNEFTWNDDESQLLYSNWAPGSPSDNFDKQCLQMTSRLSKRGSKAPGDGLWKDTSCLSNNYVVCQISQEISNSDLLQMVLETNQKIQDLQAIVAQQALEIAQNEQVDVSQSIKIEEIELLVGESDTTVPVGFIYVQLPNQPGPGELWTNMSWQEVTSTYAGQFFRAEGGNSNPFGTVQEQDAPRLNNVEYEINPGSEIAETVELTIGTPSNKLNVGSHGTITGTRQKESLRFTINNAEVRPVNTAIRIWKRIN